MRKWLNIAGLALVAGVMASGPATAQEEKGFGQVNQADPLFQRFPDLRERYFGGGEATVARHKFIAMPFPKQCAYFYVDVYSSGSMSNHDTRRDALRRCEANMQKYGPLNENYSAPCHCEVVVGRDVYRTPQQTLPGELGYAPVSLFFRDGAGRQTQQHGYAAFDLYLKPGGSTNLSVFNPGGAQVCNGSIAIPGARTGNFSLDCGRGRFRVNGQLVYNQTPIKEHTVGSGATADGGTATVVIGLPAGAARQRYGLQ